MPNVNLLERNVQKILELSGFNPELRESLCGYEIDVLLEYQTVQAVFECKQYEKSNLTVRNLIHEWSGKNQEIGADKVILVLVGVNISEEDYELAEKRDITIWDGQDVEKLLDRAIESEEEIKEEILTEAGLESTQEIQKKIEELQEKYDVSRSKVKKYLKGEIDKDQLEEYAEINEKIKGLDQSEESEVFQSLSREDKRRYVNNQDYYGTDFSKVVEVMQKYETTNKKLAQVFVDDQGGSVDGRKYYSREIKKTKLIADRLDLNLESAIETMDKLKEYTGNKDYINEKGDRPKKRFLDRSTKVMQERKDLTFSNIEELFLKGYTVTQLKNKGENELKGRENKENNSKIGDISKKLFK